MKNEDIKNLRGGEAVALVESVLKANGAPYSDFEAILYTVGYVDCVYESFYPLAASLLAIADLADGTERRDHFTGLSMRFLYAASQDDCTENCQSVFAEARELARKAFFDELAGGDDTSYQRSMLLGIAACCGDTIVANAIRDLL